LDILKMRSGSERENRVWKLCSGLPKEAIDELYKASTPSDKASITRYKTYMNNPRSSMPTAAQERARAISFLKGTAITLHGWVIRTRRLLAIEAKQDLRQSARTSENIALAMDLIAHEESVKELIARLEKANEHYRQYATRKQNQHRSSDQQQEG